MINKYNMYIKLGTIIQYQSRDCDISNAMDAIGK